MLKTCMKNQNNIENGNLYLNMCGFGVFDMFFFEFTYMNLTNFDVNAFTSALLINFSVS